MLFIKSLFFVAIMPSYFYWHYHEFEDLIIQFK